MNAVIYTRFSTDKQQSTAAQIEKCQQYADQNGLHVINVYSDEGETGTNLDRQAFKQMMADARLRLFDAVIIYDISRGSRDVGDWFAFRKAMSRLKIDVLSATQHLGDYILTPAIF